MLTDLVRTTASDGLTLNGALFQATTNRASATVDAVILLHGVGGNFYSSPLWDAVMEPLLSQEIAVLRVNTRGHDGLFNGTTSQGARRFGAAYEIVDECRLDLAAWTQFLQDQGMRRIALVGHSLGAIKALYSAAHAAPESYVAVAALSPPRLAYSEFRKSGNPAFQEAITRAEALVAAGEGEELIRANFPFPLIISAASYVDKYGREERYDILRYVPKLSCPALFLYGQIELEQGGLPFAGLERAVAEAARPGQPLEVRVVAGADHFYNGVQPEAAAQVANWLAGLGAA